MFEEIQDTTGLQKDAISYLGAAKPHIVVLHFDLRITKTITAFLQLHSHLRAITTSLNAACTLSFAITLASRNAP